MIRVFDLMFWITKFGSTPSNLHRTQYEEQVLDIVDPQSSIDVSAGVYPNTYQVPMNNTQTRREMKTSVISENKAEDQMNRNDISPSAICFTFLLMTVGIIVLLIGSNIIGKKDNPTLFLTVMILVTGGIMVCLSTICFGIILKQLICPGKN